MNGVCDIFFRLVDDPIQDPATNIRLAWAAAQLGTWLLSGLCHCSDDRCSCANQLTKETLLYLQESQALMYCREQARSQDQATVLGQFQIGHTCFARPMACQRHPCLMVGELGILRTHRTSQNTSWINVLHTAPSPAETYLCKCAEEHPTYTHAGVTASDEQLDPRTFSAHLTTDRQTDL